MPRAKVHHPDKRHLQPQVELAFGHTGLLRAKWWKFVAISAERPVLGARNVLQVAHKRRLDIDLQTKEF
jgi:hypothetical protein